MLSILLTVSPTPSTGHPLEPVAERLIRRGHRVTVIGPEEARRGLEAVGARFVGCGRIEDRVSRGTSPLPGIQQIDAQVRERFLRPLEAQWAALRGVLDTERIDVVLSDPTFLATTVLALMPRSERPPVVALGQFPLPFADPDVAPAGLGLAPLDSLLNRPRNVLLGLLVHRVLLRRVNRDIAATTMRLVGRRLRTPTADSANLPDAWAYLTVPRFEFPRSRGLASVHFLGPLPPSQDGEVPSWWYDDEDDGRPVVAVVHRPGTAADVVVPAIRALTGQGLRVVVTAGRDVDLIRAQLEDVPPDVHLTTAIPAAHLLARAAVVVGSGGWEQVQNALRYGVPLVVGGTADEQVDTNARVAWLGAGVDLRTARPKPSAIAAAVHRVLADPTIRGMTARLAAQIARTDALEDLCVLTERLALDHRAAAGRSYGCQAGCSRSR